MKLSELLKGSGIAYVTYTDCPDMEITDVFSDSRQKIGGKGLFVCLAGQRNDGHMYLRQAKERGAVAALCQTDSRLKAEDIPEGLFVIFTGDTHDALSRLLDTFCGSPTKKMKFIGVTGTNGKTSVAFMLKAIYEKASYRCGLIGTVCCKIADREISYRSNDENANMTTPDPAQLYPMLAQMADEGVEVVIMEATSHALSQKKLSPIFFDTAIFTNLTRDHLDFHKNMENYFSAKCRLFYQSRRAIINSDDEYSERIYSMFGDRCVRCSALESKNGKTVEFLANDIEFVGNSVSYKALYQDRSTEIKCRIPASFSVMNSLEAFCCAVCDGVDGDVAASALSEMSGVTGRMELVDTVADDISVYIDYAHTPDALANLLDSVRLGRSHQAKKGKIILVFGCGGDRDRTKRAVMGQIAAQKADLVFVTADNSRTEDTMQIISDILGGIDLDLQNQKIKIVPDRRQAIQEAVCYASANDTVILAGKGHEMYEINKSGRHPFDERKAARDAAERRNGKSRGDRAI